MEIIYSQLRKVAHSLHHKLLCNGPGYNPERVHFNYITRKYFWECDICGLVGEEI